MSILTQDYPWAGNNQWVWWNAFWKHSTFLSLQFNIFENEIFRQSVMPSFLVWMRGEKIASPKMTSKWILHFKAPVCEVQRCSDKNLINSLSPFLKVFPCWLNFNWELILTDQVVESTPEGGSLELKDSHRSEEDLKNNPLR